MMTIYDLEKVLPQVEDIGLKADIEYILKYAVDICLAVVVYKELNK